MTTLDFSESARRGSSSHLRGVVCEYGRKWLGCEAVIRALCPQATGYSRRLWCIDSSCGRATSEPRASPCTKIGNSRPYVFHLLPRRPCRGERQMESCKSGYPKGDRGSQHSRVGSIIRSTSKNRARTLSASSEASPSSSQNIQRGRCCGAPNVFVPSDMISVHQLKPGI